MELRMYFVDWNQAVALARDGALNNGLADALESGSEWLEDAEFPADSHILYVTAVEAWQAVRGSREVPVDIDTNARQFMDSLITHEGFAMELPKEIEDISIAISPETATRLSRSAAAVNLSVYRNAYLTECDNLTKRDFAQCAEDGTVESGFEEGFLQYVTEWITVIRSAADTGRGLLVELC